MRKGEQRKEDILRVAEELFYQKGYEKTTVNEIIELLHLSKGGFYHHFSGKDEVLADLCSRRAMRAAAYTADALNQAESPMGRINAVLRGFMPLRREEADFMAMLLPVMTKSEGRAVAMLYQDALEDDFLALLKAEIAAAAAVQAVYPPVKDMEHVILNTVNHAWMTVASAMAAAKEHGQRMESAACLALLEKYRRAIELLLDAPYGSIEILRVEEVEEVSRLIG